MGRAGGWSDAALQVFEEPARRIALELDRRGDVEEHALGEEVPEVVGVGAGQLRDPPVEVRELLANDEARRKKSQQAFEVAKRQYSPEQCYRDLLLFAAQSNGATTQRHNQCGAST